MKEFTDGVDLGELGREFQSETVLGKKRKLIGINTLNCLGKTTWQMRFPRRLLVTQTLNQHVENKFNKNFGGKALKTDIAR